MQIREASDVDFDAIWPIFHEIASAGETYAYDRDITKSEAFKLWIKYPQKTFVFDDDGEILGTYYIVKNHSGPGDHVCNCGYGFFKGQRKRSRRVYVQAFSRDSERVRVQGYAVQFRGLV